MVSVRLERAASESVVEDRLLISTEQPAAKNGIYLAILINKPLTKFDHCCG